MTITGMLPALLTAYDDAGEVSTERTRVLVEQLNRAGMDGYFVTGTSGEYYLLSLTERLRILETVAETAGRRHVIFQVAAADQRDVRELARQARDHGATAISASIPIYYGYSDESLADYFREVRDAGDLPLLGYTIPSLTGRTLDAGLLTTLASEGTLQGLKYTSSDLEIFARLRASTPESFSLLLGSDELVLAALAMGADGGIGAAFNLAPRLFAELYRAHREEDAAEARRLQMLAVDMLDMLSDGEVYPVLKSAMRVRGMDVGQARAPMAQHSPDGDARVAASLDRVDGLAQYLISGPDAG